MLDFGTRFMLCTPLAVQLFSFSEMKTFLANILKAEDDLGYGGVNGRIILK
jgi:hypothetical protein